MLALMLAAAPLTPVWAINKCTAPDGKTVYQDAPCAANQKGESLNWIPNSEGQLPFRVLDLSAEDAQAAALDAVATAKDRLKDPDSAKFAGLRVLRFNGQGKVYVMTCGQLNAKNSYGGYVGSKPFWVYRGIFTETFDHYLVGSGSSLLMGNVQAACLRSGKPVSLDAAAQR